jgi:hypothetical protein
MVTMKTQEQLRAEYDRLFEAEEYEAAARILDLLDPISDEEWLRIVNDAPEVDEPIPDFIRERSRALEGVFARRSRQAG